MPLPPAPPGFYEWSVPEAVFSHDQAGRLRVVFQAQWYINGGDYDSAGNIVLRCYVGEGASRKTAQLSAGVHTATIEVDYPGGYADMPVGMEYVDHTVAGPVTMRMQPLVITCELI